MLGLNFKGTAICKLMSLDKILINAANVTGAGANALTRSLLPPLARAFPSASFTILLPDSCRSWNYDALDNVSVVYFPVERGIRNDLKRLQQLFFQIRKFAKDMHADVCLSLGDIPPLGLPCPSVILLHQPLLAYSLKEINGHIPWPWYKRAYLKTHFQWSARNADRIIVQTDVMAARLARTYGVDPARISVIPQPTPMHVLAPPTSNAPSLIRPNPKPIKLTYLAAYYPHKNHDILPAVGAELRRRNLTAKVHIFTTIDLDRCQSHEVRNCFAEFSDVITNIGPVKSHDVRSLLADSSALFFPTLLECFSLVYVEALSLGLPILTSDRDFAHASCGNMAKYFDPLSATSIVDSIQEFSEWKIPDDYALLAKEELRRFPPDWDAAANLFGDVLKQVTGNARA